MNTTTFSWPHISMHEHKCLIGFRYMDITMRVRNAIQKSVEKENLLTLLHKNEKKEIWLVSLVVLLAQTFRLQGKMPVLLAKMVD